MDIPSSLRQAQETLNGEMASIPERLAVLDLEYAQAEVRAAHH
jgi:hypothetical protein